MSLPRQHSAERLDRLGVTLSEGYRTEVCLSPETWLREAFAAIERGYLLLVDYGHEASKPTTTSPAGQGRCAATPATRWG